MIKESRVPISVKRCSYVWNAFIRVKRSKGGFWERPVVSAAFQARFLSRFKFNSNSNQWIPFFMEDCRDWRKKKGRCPHCSEDVAGRCNSACGAANRVRMIYNDGCQGWLWKEDRCEDCSLKEEGEEDGVDRERCWYVKEGLFVAKRDWRLMLTVDWREGGNGLLWSSKRESKWNGAKRRRREEMVRN